MVNIIKVFYNFWELLVNLSSETHRVIGEKLYTILRVTNPEMGKNVIWMLVNV